MNIKTDYNLHPHNTLQLEAKAAYYCQVKTVDDLTELSTDKQFKDVPWFILGGGSNTLFSQNWEGLVVHNQILGKDIIKETDEYVLLQLGSGENWPEMVEYCVAHNWGGVENLAMIPGTAGAAPVQNIAAYGQNLSDVLESVTYYDRKSQKLETLKADDCKFSYRDSIFKHELHNRAIITSIVLKLAINPQLETSYYSIGGRNDSLQKELSFHAKKPYTVQDVYDAVIRIRTSKLLDWKTHPTVGSFFINPVVPYKKYQSLKKVITNLQAYPVEDLRYHSSEDSSKDDVKIPVGRILDHLGWKGKKIGNCAVSDKLASIITHNGLATGAELLQFTQTIKQSVFDTFGIELETEVTIV